MISELLEQLHMNNPSWDPIHVQDILEGDA